MSVYEFGPFQLDKDRLLLLHDGEPVALGPKVVETLLALVEHPGDVLSKSALLDRIWPEGFVEEANLAQNIYVLRKTLRAQWDCNAIETVPRRGYRFTAAVRVVDRVEPANPEVIVLQAPPAAPIPRTLSRRLVAALASAAVAVFALSGISLQVISGGHTQAHAPLSASGARIYAIGRYYWNTRTRDGVEKSLNYFAQVIDSDPRNALGYAALAQANATMGDYHYGTLKPYLYFDRARAYAEKALALDPQSAEAHSALGLISLDTKKLPDALNELARAIQLDPSYGPAHEWYGIGLLTRGDLREAVGQLRLAADLDPLSVSTVAWLGSAAYYNRRFDEAIAYARQTLDLSPKRADAYATIGLAYEARGDYARAIESYRKFGALDPEGRGQAAAYLAHVYALAHRPAEARNQLDYAMAHAQHVETADLALAAAATGRKTVAFGMLRRTHDSMTWTAIANDPRYDALRRDAQFRQLAQGPA
jgi:DNA-binding winged helix-turn-helix (wHTH) protein/Flp pilus assembly protein TadD